MPTAVFDSLQYFEQLKEAGFSEKQAKVQANAMREIIEEKLATKGDIARLEKEMAQQEARLTSEMQKLELRLTVKLGGMIAASIAIVAALVKIL